MCLYLFCLVLASQGDVATKTQKLKQYNKQADNLKDELGPHKEIHIMLTKQVRIILDYWLIGWLSWYIN